MKCCLKPKIPAGEELASPHVTLYGHALQLLGQLGRVLSQGLVFQDELVFLTGQTFEVVLEVIPNRGHQQLFELAIDLEERVTKVTSKVMSVTMMSQHEQKRSCFIWTSIT